MRILVTGGAGFIGSNVADRFLALGHDVAVLDNLSTGRAENVDPRIKFYKADLVDRAGIDKAIEDWKPEIVDHLPRFEVVPAGLLGIAFHC